MQSEINPLPKQIKMAFINPPHSNPTGPTLGLALLSSYVKSHFSSDTVQCKIYDLGIDSLYWLMSEKVTNYAFSILQDKLELLDELSSLNYEQQQSYVKNKEALKLVEVFSGELEHAIEIEKDSEAYLDQNQRNTAHFIINRYLEGIGNAWDNTDRKSVV